MSNKILLNKNSDLVKMCFAYEKMDFESATEKQGRKVKSANRESGVTMGVLMAFWVYLASLQVVLASEDPGRGKCGVTASSHPLHQDPWLIFMEYQHRGRLTELRCAATLITPRHAITAGHCFASHKKYNKLVARLGEYKLSSHLDCQDGVCADPVVRIPVEKVIPYPSYDGTEHDIAVLVLAEEAPYTDFIRPVCLPTGSLNTSAVFHAAGWGEIPYTGQYSDVKKSIPLPLWPNSCQSAYKYDVVSPHVICAGGVQGMDTCRGDSGGPLIWTKETEEIWGITSQGPSVCGKEGKPGLYTNVVYHREWIVEVINST